MRGPGRCSSSLSPLEVRRLPLQGWKTGPSGIGSWGRGRGGDQGGRCGGRWTQPSGTPWLLAPDFGMRFFFFFFFGVKFPVFVGLMDQKKDASLGPKAELILQLLKELLL